MQHTEQILSVVMYETAIHNNTRSTMECALEIKDLVSSYFSKPFLWHFQIPHKPESNVFYWFWRAQKIFYELYKHHTVYRSLIYFKKRSNIAAKTLFYTLAEKPCNVSKLIAWSVCKKLVIYIQFTIENLIFVHLKKWYYFPQYNYTKINH